MFAIGDVKALLRDTGDGMAHHMLCPRTRVHSCRPEIICPAGWQWRSI
jgi:hypothetical protein